MSPEKPLTERFTNYLQYWRTLERAGTIPSISRLFDKPDAQIHPWLNIVDADEDYSQPIRYAGTNLVNYFGKDLTRTNFLDILSPQARPIILKSHHEIVGRPCGAYHESLCSALNGREFELLAMGLPLSRPNGRHCVAWLLEPHATVSFGEVHVLVERISRWTWVDLGYGVPASEAA